MDALTVTFLAIGGLALLLLALSLIGGHAHLGHLHLGDVHLGDVHLGHLHLGHAQAGHAGGELTLPAIVGFLGTFGFGGAIVASLLGGHGAGTALVAIGAGLVLAVPAAWAAGRLVSAAVNMPTDATLTSGDLAGGHLDGRLVPAGSGSPGGGPGAEGGRHRRGPGAPDGRTGTDAGRGGHAESERNLALKRSAVQAEVDAAKARTAAAGPLAEAERQEAILTEQQKVAERNAELRERQLETEVRKPADAARYKLEQEAEAARNAAVMKADAERQATIAAAQATAEQARLMGEGEKARWAALADANAIEGAKQGEAEQRRRTAIADAVEREGAAEATAIQARGEAEADAMRAKAEAFASYGEAAVLDLLVRVLPQVVQAAAAPLSAIDKMTVISTDGAGALTKSVAANVASGLQLGSDLTGVDLNALLAKLGGAATSNGRVEPRAVESGTDK